ncbi:MAG: hypothetical protein U5K36_07445 [Roseovarius sp.]|nr:hypothetical protein [Roseovarius sp.]
MSDTIQRAQMDGVMVLRLDRPVANALVLEMRAALIAALTDAAEHG